MNHKILSGLFLVVVLALSACQAATSSPTAIPSATLEPAVIYTSVAQTAAVRLTDIALQTPSATPEPPSPTPDLQQTSAAQTALVAMLSETPALSPTVNSGTALTPNPSATATFIPSGLDKAVYVADVTIPDKTVLAAKTEFVKTWKIQNSGTSTWTTAYQLVFVSGERMGEVESVRVPIDVPPGAQIDISVTMVAPDKDGTYKGFWQMRNPAGLYFGEQVYVEIIVGAVTPTGEIPSQTPLPTTPSP
jgi:hypothetical protein